MVGAESPETPPGELRRLSAADTDFGKVAPVLAGTLWVLGFALAGVPLPVILVGAIGWAIGIWQALRLKVVETDGTTLFVSTMSRTMSLPLTWVESIDLGWWPLGTTVTITFRQVTPFGQTIVFQRKSGFWTGEDGVEELRALVAQAGSRRS